VAVELDQLVRDFASGIEEADLLRPAWVSTSGRAYSPGIGPHTESRTIDLALEQLRRRPDYASPQTSVPYPLSPRQKCDLVLDGEWAVEVKMLRFMGDNGKPNDNILMHILSPYPAHRSALTDCMKLRTSGFRERLAVLIYGYDYPAWPMDPAIDAFETLALRTTELSPRTIASFGGLVHPVHQEGRVFGWEVLRRVTF
jgi:hypothetical protein